MRGASRGDVIGPPGENIMLFASAFPLGTRSLHHVCVDYRNRNHDSMQDYLSTGEQLLVSSRLPCHHLS